MAWSNDAAIQDKRAVNLIHTGESLTEAAIASSPPSCARNCPRRTPAFLALPRPELEEYAAYAVSVAVGRVFGRGGQVRRARRRHRHARGARGGRRRRQAGAPRVLPRPDPAAALAALHDDRDEAPFKKTETEGGRRHPPGRPTRRPPTRRSSRWTRRSPTPTTPHQRRLRRRRPVGWFGRLRRRLAGDPDVVEVSVEGFSESEDEVGTCGEWPHWRRHGRRPSPPIEALVAGREPHVGRPPRSASSTTMAAEYKAHVEERRRDHDSFPKHPAVHRSISDDRFALVTRLWKNMAPDGTAVSERKTKLMTTPSQRSISSRACSHGATIEDD